MGGLQGRDPLQPMLTALLSAAPQLSSPAAPQPARPSGAAAGDLLARKGLWGPRERDQIKPGLHGAFTVLGENTQADCLLSRA